MRWLGNVRAGMSKITLSIVASLPMMAGAEVYTGVGAHGVRWFSDVRPAAGVAYDVVQTTSATATPVTVAPDQEVDKGKKKASSAKTNDIHAESHADTPGAAAKARPRSSRVEAQEKARQKRCRGYETALRKLRAQRRAGYTVEQDRKQRQRRAELQEKQYSECSLRAGL